MERRPANIEADKNDSVLSQLNTVFLLTDYGSQGKTIYLYLVFAVRSVSMEQILEMLNKVFGEGGDLAGIASAAGLGGGATSAAAVVAFRGMVMKFIVRIVTTAAFTGIGFLVLLNQLGFEIVPKEDLQISQNGNAKSPLYSEWVGIEGMSTQVENRLQKAEREGKRVIVLGRRSKNDENDNS
ncbi:hypothetical protein Hbal_3003 [Hirschia baltica ATCC 49814]|uniref:Uncharacterized protein n=2 Tax=Hirschia TaxID=2723 RepID=C6XRR1_HIRBI|nr:hypothetical protein Hbal_3003 [Hirschia baltica ATCC 49814]